MREIEIKARIPDPEALRKLLDGKAVFIRNYQKEDIYFTASADESRTRFRIRSEGERYTVTLKEKTPHEGIELNKEYEFAVSDPGKFILFAQKTGFHLALRKRKKGRLYQYNGLNLEFGIVEGLGWFLEVEKILPEDEMYRVEEIKGDLLRTLEEFSISKNAVEPRYYTTLLREKQNDGKAVDHDPEEA